MEHTDTILENSLNIENDTTHYTDNSNFEIPLELNDRLKSKGIIQKFVKDKKHNCIIIELNHKYENNTIVILTNNIKNWTKFQEEVKNSLNRKCVYDIEDIRLIQNTIDDNYELILGITYNINNDNYNNNLVEEKKN